MKFIIGVLVVGLVVAGAYFGFNVGKNDNLANNTTTNTSESQPDTSNANLLDLNNQGLASVGPDIYSKTNITDLILSNNSIKTLPSEMGKMTKVVNFKIDHNKLEGSLIGEIRQMAGLRTLDVSYNNMTGMPAEIGQLSNIVTLNYSYNNITGLPNELANLKNNLKEFNLTGNPLSQDTINKLKESLPNTTIIF